MYRRRILRVCGLVVGGFGTVGAVSSRPTEIPSASQQTTTRSHRFSGNGPTRTDAFKLEDGVTTVNFDHDGESAFRTDLVGVDDAESNDPLVDDDGATEGGRALVTEGGRYALEITADGPWTVDCIQPTVDGVGLVSPPHTDSGSGVDYTGPVSVNETTELTGIHYGDGSFSVWAHTADKNSYHLIEASRTAEKKTQARIDGPTWLDVDADGEWHLELR